MDGIFVPKSTNQISKSEKCKYKSGNNKVNDTHGHGTHIAGIIGAEGGNGIGLSGVAPQVSLMALNTIAPVIMEKTILITQLKRLNMRLKMVLTLSTILAVD